MKTLTPIGKAIEYCKQQASRHSDWGNDAPRTYHHNKMVEFLESLLPEEKQFAEDAFSRGTVCGDNPEYTHHDSFLRYYKKYEDDTTTENKGS